MGDIIKLTDFLKTRKEELTIEDESFTACVDCGHFIGQDAYLADIKWEESLCGALENELAGRNPINRKPLYYYINGEGDIVHTDKPNLYAIDINPEGKCQYYKKFRKGQHRKD